MYRFISIVFLSLFLVSNGYSQEISGTLNLARELAKEGKYKEAISEYQKVIASNTSNELKGSSQYMIARIYDFNLQNREKALEEYKKFLKDYSIPGFTERVEERVKHLSEAIGKYAHIIEVLDRAKYEYGTKARKRHISFFKEVVHKYPDFPKLDKVYEIIGDEYWRENQNLMALLYWKKAIRINHELKPSLEPRLKSVRQDIIRYLIYWKVHVLLGVIILAAILFGKPWRYIRLKQLVLLGFCMLLWIVMVLGVFILYWKFLPIPFPEGVVEPAYVILWFEPFVSPILWKFICMTVLGIVIVFLASMGLQSIKRKYLRLYITVLSTVLITILLLSVFHLHYLNWWEYEKRWFYSYHDTDYYGDLYPDRFKFITTDDGIYENGEIE